MRILKTKDIKKKIFFRKFCIGPITELLKRNVQILCMGFSVKVYSYVNKTHDLSMLFPKEPEQKESRLWLHNLKDYTNTFLVCYWGLNPRK